MIYAAFLGLATSLELLGDGEGAIAACREAIACTPDRSAAFGVMALAQMRCGAINEAAASAAQAVRLGDGGAAMQCLSATIELRRGRVPASLAAIAAALTEQPGCTRARALRRLAEWCRDGDVEQLGWSNLIQVTRPAPPPGFASIHAFNAALATAIRGECAASLARHGGPLVNGDRLPDTDLLAPHMAAAVRALFAAEAARYTARKPDNGRDGLDCGVAALRNMRVWANIMGPGAYERPHIHEDGELSCVYYPELPDKRSVGGELVFGPHDLGPAVPASPSYLIAPALGQMIIFPSYLYHSTLPFSGQGQRISVAADIVGSKRAA